MKKPEPSLVALPPRDALYLCLRCRLRWQGKAGPVRCPRCTWLKVVWLDYEREPRPPAPGAEAQNYDADFGDAIAGEES